MVRTVLCITGLVSVLSVPTIVGAQQGADTARTATPPPAAAALPLDFSGVILANFQYRGDGGSAHSQNKFDLERAYLTFKMPAGERASIRITADVFQQTTGPGDSFYKGWVVRAKYAYLQYDYLKSATWNGLARGGLIHNVVIDHIESFWPRWISPTSVERAGFFSSSDAGVGTVVTFPNKSGELYATVSNGSGYTSRETDRFKDYAARISFTPLTGANNKIAKTFALSAWTYRGAIASAFAGGGTGQIGPVGASLPRIRSGVFAGVRDPRLSAGAEWDVRNDGKDLGSNTLLSPRSEMDSSGRLVAAFINAKPLQLLNEKSSSPLGVVARWDRFTPNTATSGYVSTVIAGLTWDLNRKTALALDYQEVTPHHGASAAASKTYFLHLVANF